MDDAFKPFKKMLRALKLEIAEIFPLRQAVYLGYKKYKGVRSMALSTNDNATMALYFEVRSSFLTPEWRWLLDFSTMHLLHEPSGIVGIIIPFPRTLALDQTLYKALWPLAQEILDVDLDGICMPIPVEDDWYYRPADELMEIGALARAEAVE